MHSDLFVSARELELLHPLSSPPSLFIQSSQYWQPRKKAFLKRCEQMPGRGDVTPWVIAATKNEQNTGQKAIRSWQNWQELWHVTLKLLQCTRHVWGWPYMGNQSHLYHGFVNYVTLVSCLSFCWAGTQTVELSCILLSCHSLISFWSLESSILFFSQTYVYSLSLCW